MIMFYFFPFFVSSLFVHTPSSTKHQYPQTEINNKTNKETNKQKHVSHNLVGCKCFNAIMVTNIFFFSCYFPSFFQRYYQIVIFSSAEHSIMALTLNTVDKGNSPFSCFLCWRFMVIFGKRNKIDWEKKNNKGS